MSCLPSPLLLSDRGCPYAHRVLALLDHLGVACESRDAPLGQLPEGLERWSPSGRIPLLVHGGLAISESRVMLEYLAEVYGFASAYSDELMPRTLERHAMALMDVVIAPRLGRGEEGLDAQRLSECLDAIEDAARSSHTEPSLLSFHLAPIWLRFRWLRPNAMITRAIGERAQLAVWLDRAGAIAAIRRTAPNPADAAFDFQVACALAKNSKL